MTATCRCGVSWSGGRPEHCPACHETFVGTSAGDRHRVGDHDAPRDSSSRRRCLDAAEMIEAGLRTDDRGMWFVKADRERLAQAMSSRLEVPE